MDWFSFLNSFSLNLDSYFWNYFRNYFSSTVFMRNVYECFFLKPSSFLIIQPLMKSWGSLLISFNSNSTYFCLSGIISGWSHHYQYISNHNLFIKKTTEKLWGSFNEAIIYILLDEPYAKNGQCQRVERSGHHVTLPMLNGP